MSKLTIIDASCYLHSGTKSKLGKNRTHFDLKVGGIEKLTEAIMRAIKVDDTSYVMVMFDSPTDRKDYMPSYKSDRVLDPDVAMQDKLSLTALQKVGVQCFRVPGCESDDLIYEAVKRNYNLFNKIVVKTNDMDLTAVIDMDGKVSIETPTSISYNVTRKTYETVLSGTSTAKEVVKKWKTTELEIEPISDVNNNNYMNTVNTEQVVFFNSITAFKVFFGDKSDGISPISGREDLLNIYYRFCKWGKEKTGHFSTLSDAQVMIDYYTENPENFNEAELEELYNRINVFYPRIVPVDLTYNFNLHISDDEMYKMACLFGLRNVGKLYGKEIRTAPEQIKWLKDIAFKVKSGKFAVDNDLMLNNVDNVVDEKIENIDVYMGQNIGSF